MDLPSVTQVTFDSTVVDSDRPVLVDFWADWCHPCHILEPVVKDIAKEHSSKVNVVKLNVDENPALAQKYGVMSIPTLLLFVDGAEKVRLVGARGKDQIVKELQPYF